MKKVGERSAMYLRDNPIIENMKLTGYPDDKEPKYPRCPVCGEETDTFYLDANNEIVGCSECIHKIDAWDF